jgi:nucleoporin GLE1
VDAQQVYDERQRQLEAEYLRALNEQVKLRSLRHQQQMEEVRQLFSGMRVHHGEEENRLRTEFEKRDQALWSSVQQAIDDEERKIAAQKAEEEKKAREELLRRQREEKARQEAQAQKEQKEKEERFKKELELKKLQKEAEEIRIREEKQRQEAIEQRKQAEQLSAAGIRPALDEWEEGRRMLSILKKEVHPAIKADRELKSLRNKLRRQVTPKIGQLTSEMEQISRVVSQSSPTSSGIILSILSDTGTRSHS